MGCKNDGTDWGKMMTCKYKDSIVCSEIDYNKCNIWCVCHPEHAKAKMDIVNHPAHYTDGKIEVIDYIEDKGFNYHLGQAIKYISRAGKKNPDKYTEDLKKAVWYLNREIERVSK